MALLDVAVAIPGLACPVPDLHISHPPLDQPPGNQQLAAVWRVAVAVKHVLGLTGDVKGFTSFKLHSPGQFHRGQPGLKLWIVLTTSQMLAVKGRRQLELSPLGFSGKQRMPDAFDQLIGSFLLGVDVGTLKHARQEGAPPVGRATDGITTRAHGNEAGQVLVFGPQAIGHPSARSRPDQPGISAVH